MFSGIIENIGKVVNIQKLNIDHYEITLSTTLLPQLNVGDSLSHDGICCTITKILSNAYQIIAVAETLQKTNIRYWRIHDRINLEQPVPSQGRLHGHLVQGHIDQIAQCIAIQAKGSSWQYTFSYNSDPYFLVEKGSVAVNGVSLTCFHVSDQSFDVAIIPHTYHYTNFQNLQMQTYVNLEFDIIGKYIHQHLQKYLQTPSFKPSFYV